MDASGVESYTTVEELLRRTKRERAKLAALWQGLDAAQMTRRPGPQDGWSVKDLIAHIVWWEDAMREIAPKSIAGETIAFDGTVAEANAGAFAQKRDLPLPEVLAEFAASLERVESFLRQLDDRQINDTDICQIFGKPLRHFIAANTYGHYADHIDDLSAYVERVKAEAL